MTKTKYIDADDFKVFIQNLIKEGAPYEGVDTLIDKTKPADVEPKRKWHWCKEGLPFTDNKVIAVWYRYDKFEDITYTYMDLLFYNEQEGWYDINDKVPNGEVIAWMELPGLPSWEDRQKYAH